MKKRIFSVLLVLSLAFSALTFGVYAADTPTVSNNVGHDYGNYNYPAASHLVAQNNGYARVEYVGNGMITIDQYDQQFKFLSHRELALELPIYGGVYLGPDYNFVVCGQSNDEEDDNKEVIRVIRYSKDWERQAAASLHGANTTAPFEAGTVDMAQSGDMLYVRSCHQMYTSSDGLRHQANIQLSVRISDMTITEHQTGVSNSSTDYVSHSFNQFARIDGTDYLAVDHGDAFPRSVILFKYENSAGAQTLQSYPQSVEVLPIAGQIGNNFTGVNVGGFEASDSAYLVAGNSIDQNANTQQRNIFVSVTPKDSFTQEATQIKWITNYPEGSGVAVGNPYLVKISGTQFMLLWNEGSELKYVLLDANAQITSQVYTAQVSLSGCHPIVVDGKITWYNTNDTAPNFYQIDLANPGTVRTYFPNGSVFEDVAPDAYYYEPVNWAVSRGITAGVSPTEFGPQNTCTRGQIVTFLWASQGRPEPTSTANPFADVSSGDYYYKAVLWAVENGITSGVSANQFAPSQTCTRGQTVTFLWAAQNKPSVSGGASFSDVTPGDYFADAVQWAVANGVTAGVGGDRFGPSQNCTRGQIVTFLYKAMN